MSDYPLSGLDYARAKPPGRPQVEPVFKGSPYAAGPRYSGGATNAPIAPAKPMKPGAMAQVAPKPAAPASGIPPSATGKTAPLQSVEDSAFAKNMAGTPVYANQMTNPQDQKEYGKAIYSDSFKGATKGGFAEGLKPPKPLSAQELKDRQLYWQQVRAGVDADISRRALTRAAFNRGNSDAVRASAMGQLGGMADLPQRAAEFAQTTDQEKQKLGMLQQAADREWQSKQDWFTPRALEAVPDNATAEMYADIQARNRATQQEDEIRRAMLMKWVMDQLASGNNVSYLDAYKAHPEWGIHASSYDQQQMMGPAKTYAEGGVVEDTYSGSGVGIDLLAKYQDYAERTQEVGAEPVPFEDFAQMQDGAMQRFALGGPVRPPGSGLDSMSEPSIMDKPNFMYDPNRFNKSTSDPRAGPESESQNQLRAQEEYDYYASREWDKPALTSFANGGSVAGKMVVDTDPNAPMDSIPATVDGDTPARLNSGEFVFPADVVAHFGTDRLNKMIQAARKGAMAGAQ